ncbi:MAG TPA: hypothetical protein VEA69_15830 [Tepidisphaeraceae bacterium]|nr:hypothetical protein [Tepidisphaeraceae bacterium]
MPSPSTALSTLRPDLAGSFQEFDLDMDARGFVAQRVLPAIDVAKPSGTFGKIKIASLLAQRDTLRAPGSGYARQRYEFEKDSYATEEHGAEDAVDDKEAEMYGDYLNAEQTATSRARDVVMRNYEQRVATLLQTTGSFTNAAAATAWSTTATAVPLTDIETRVQAIWNATGMKPNAIVIPFVAFRNLRNCAQVVDRIKYSGLHNPAAGAIGTEAIAQLLDIPNVIVAGAKKNGANEGQTASLSNIWTATVVGIGVIATNNDIKAPCVGRTFHYSADGSKMGGTVETYREEQTRSDVVRVRMDTDEKLLYSACWQLITGC